VIATELEPAGVAMTLLSSPRAGTESPTGNVAMDGAIVYSVDDDSPALPWLRRRGIPLVFVDQKPEPRISSVNVDDRRGARAVAQHLIDFGHRRIGIVTQGLAAPLRALVPPHVDAVHHVVRERMGGWLDVLSASGVEPIVANQYDNSFEASELSARLILDTDQPPTAILCLTDLMAVGVLTVARARRLSVPGDLSVTGFDDQPLASASRPMLTTVRQPFDAKARAAAQALLTAIESMQRGTAARARRVVLPTELIVRDSTSAPR
jgi:DNA-binding LacI/PurR family transcriptional regulator